MSKQSRWNSRRSYSRKNRSSRAFPKLTLAVVGSAIVFLSSACSPNSISPTEPRIEVPEVAPVASTASARLKVSETTVNGRVKGIDTSAGEILLENGALVVVGRSTKWDRGGSFHSIRELAAAFSRGQVIGVKARGPVNVAGDLKARTIKAIAR